MASPGFQHHDLCLLLHLVQQRAACGIRLQSLKAFRQIGNHLGFEKRFAILWRQSRDGNRPQPLRLQVQ